MAIKKEIVFLQHGQENDPAVTAILSNPRYLDYTAPGEPVPTTALAYIDELDGMVRDNAIESKSIRAELAVGLGVPRKYVDAWFSKEISYNYSIEYMGETFTPEQISKRISTVASHGFSIGKYNMDADLWIDTKNFVVIDGELVVPYELAGRFVDENIAEKLTEDEDPGVDSVYLDYRYMVSLDGEDFTPEEIEDRLRPEDYKDLVNGDYAKKTVEVVKKREFDEDIDYLENSLFGKLSAEKAIAYAESNGWVPARRRTKVSAVYFLKYVLGDYDRARILNQEFGLTPYATAQVIDNTPYKVLANNPAQVTQHPIMLVDHTFEKTSLYTLPRGSSMRLRAILALAIAGKLKQEPTSRQGGGVFGEKGNIPAGPAPTVRSRAIMSNAVDTLKVIQNMLDGGNYATGGTQSHGLGKPYLDNFWTQFDGFAVTQRRRLINQVEVEYDVVEFYFDYFPNYGEE